MKLMVLLLTTSIILSCNQLTQNKTDKKELQQIKTTTVTEQQTPFSQTENKKKRKLRYLFYANGGLIGYFDDGTVATCPRCDLINENIKSLYSIKPFKKYTVGEDGSLLMDGNIREYPTIENENGNREWAMIDYKWIVDL